MKNCLLGLVIGMLLFASLGLSQSEKGLQWSSATVSTGKGALSSGLDATMIWKNLDNGQTLQFTANADRGYGLYRWRFGMFTPGVTLGVYKTAPIGGPQLIVSPWPWLTTTHWYLLSAGWAGKPAWQSHQFCVYNSVAVIVGPFSATYSLVKFQQEKIKRIPGVKYVSAINDHFLGFLSAEYNTRKEDPGPLYQIGFKYVP